MLSWRVFLDASEVGSLNKEMKAGIASTAITGKIISRLSLFSVKRTISWNKKQVIDPNCLFTEND